MGVTIENMFVCEFFYLYGGGKENIIFTVGTTLPRRYFKRSSYQDMDPNMPERLFRP
jgi:hypothetical protein